MPLGICNIFHGKSKLKIIIRRQLKVGNDKRFTNINVHMKLLLYYPVVDTFSIHLDIIQLYYLTLCRHYGKKL